MGNHLFLRQQPVSPSAMVQSVGKQDTVPRKSHTVHHAQKVFYSGTPQMAGRSFHFVTIHAKKEKKEKTLFVRFVHSPRGHGKIRPAANRLSKCHEYGLQLLMLTFACILLSVSAGKKKSIKKHSASFIFRTACNNTNKLQNG